MDQEYLECSLKEIRHLLSHLHSEVTALEASYSKVLLVLQGIEVTKEIDELTGLLRRNAFFSRWKKVLDECKRLNQSCGLLMIDIDHFKKVNDTHGHMTGDEVIRGVSMLLKQFESPNCVLGRYGGEEFAVAIRGKDAEVLGVAEMIRRGAERLHGPVIGADGKEKAEVQWKCTLSLGMASAQKLEYDATRLLAAADEALYEAKKRGRNQVRAA